MRHLPSKTCKKEGGHAILGSENQEHAMVFESFEGQNGDEKLKLFAGEINLINGKLMLSVTKEEKHIILLTKILK